MIQILFFTIALFTNAFCSFVAIALPKHREYFIATTIVFLFQVFLFILEPTKSFYVIFAAIPFIISAYKQTK